MADFAMQKDNLNAACFLGGGIASRRVRENE